MGEIKEVIVTYLPVLLSILVGLTYFLVNYFNLKRFRHAPKMVSFAAGVSITYVLLELFPVFTEITAQISKFLFFSVLLGFIIHHIIEKEIYMHNRRHELLKKLSTEEQVFSFVYHLILGMLLVTFVQQRLLDGILFFIPILLFVFISTLPAERHASTGKALFLASATLLGSLFSTFIWIRRPLWIEGILVGFVTGVLLFTIVRHHIPFGRAGNVGYFSLGFVLYALVIMASWYF